jgi:uncharacterized repeat protein (TIGR02543 family)
MWTWPVAHRNIPDGGQFKSTYYVSGGRRVSRSLPHSGLDYSGHGGQTIVAIGPGVVKARSTSYTPGRGWGYYVWIDHGNGIYSGYAHMRAACPLPVGTPVDGGTVLGRVGMTGEATGEHLHWAIARGDWGTIFAVGSAMRALLLEPEAFVSARIDPLEAAERKVGAKEARFRTAPTTASKYEPKLNAKPGTQIRPAGFVRGQVPKGEKSDVWFVVVMPDGKAGYSHASGYTDQGTHDLVDLTPKPTPVRTVTVDDGDGVLEVLTYEIPEGERLVSVVPLTTRPGYTFAGWFEVTDLAVPYDFGEPITSDVTIVAKWLPVPVDQTPEPEPPAEPDPEEEAPVTIKKPLSAAQLAKLVRDAEKAGVKFATSPDQPIIPDRVARPLWVILGAVAVSVGPAAALTVLGWGEWDAEVATQFSTIVGAWVGALAAVLGLSRFAKTK